MSLPNRAAVIYFPLTKPDGVPKGTGVLPTTEILSDYYTTYPESLADQQNFYSYQHYFPDYPNELIAKVPNYGWSLSANVISIGQGGATAECSLLYPVNAQTEYNPGPPLYPGGPSYEPVPTPNGTSDTVYTDFGEPLTITSILPRWHTASAFDYSSSTGTPSPYSFFSAQGIVPKKGHVHQISVFPGYPNPANHIVTEINFVGSWDVQVNNLQSAVLNQQTNTTEYYPYTQATTVFKQTGKYVIPNQFEVCCWNDGTVVSGKVSIYSVDIITGTLPASGNGWMGMTVEIGTTFSPVEEITWSVTISDSYTPYVITIPKVAGKATFVNDFWVTEVVPPT
jgi:hypothetical protein